MREQLMDIIQACNLMLQEIEKEMVSINELGKKIDFGQLENISKKFNFSNSILKNMSEVYKISYIRMMLFIIRDIEDDRKLENALLHILKVTQAANLNINIEEEFILVHKINENDFKIIIQDLTAMSETESQTFVIDVMYMLTASDIVDKDIKETFGAIVTKLGLREVQIRELFELINIIVNRDVNAYREFCKRELSIDLRDFYSYTGEFVSGIMAENKILYWINETIPFDQFLRIARKEKEKVNSFFIEKYYFSSKRILLQNLKINFAQHIYFIGEEIVLENCDINIGNYKFAFLKCKRIIFNRCRIVNILNSLNFKECEHVLFKNTFFEGNGSVKCFEMQKSIQIEVKDCSFVDFSRNEYDKYQNEAYFGCFFIQNISKVRFCNTCFKNCMTKHYERGKANCAVGGIYGTKDIIFNQCNFVNCENSIWQYGTTWNDAGYMFEFDKGVNPDFKNCTFENCVECIEPSRK